MIEHVLIIFIAFSGFLLATYLYHKKRTKNEHFVCPMKGKCSEVIHSDFSRFLGVPVEILGMIYYAFIAVGYVLVTGLSDLFGWADPFLLIASTLAFFFSVYLTFIQIAALKRLCTWCLLSAAFCTIIFLLAVLGSLEVVLPFLSEHKQIFLILHVLSMSLGLGATTLTVVFFFKFLKDFRISEHESEVLSTISDFIWFAIGIILMTGLALYVPESAVLNRSSQFLVKAFVVGVVIINGSILSFLVAPKLVRISFGQQHHHKDGELIRMRRVAFILGPISIVSWYSAFVLGILPHTAPYTVTQLFFVYLTSLGIVLICSQLWERHLTRTAHRTAS